MKLQVGADQSDPTGPAPAQEPLTSGPWRPTVVGPVLAGVGGLTPVTLATVGQFDLTVWELIALSWASSLGSAFGLAAYVLAQQYKLRAQQEDRRTTIEVEEARRATTVAVETAQRDTLQAVLAAPPTVRVSIRRPDGAVIEAEPITPVPPSPEGLSKIRADRPTG